MYGRLTDPRWIRVQSRVDAQRQDYIFGMTMVYILDYIDKDRPGPQNIPAVASQFAHRRSYYVMCLWSWVLWEDWAASGVLQTEYLLIFFGRMASLVFLPLRESPQHLVTYIISFYELMIRDDWVRKNIQQPAHKIEVYLEAIQRALQKIRHTINIVNQWKNDTELLYDTWINNVFPKWQRALDTGIVQTHSYWVGDTQVTRTGDPVRYTLESGTAEMRHAHLRHPSELTFGF